MRPTKHLIKRHTAACGARSFTHYACDCQWSIYYRGIEKVLSAWIDKPIDPRAKRDAIDALNRCKAAIDNGAYDPKGERPAVGSDQTLKALIEEWITRYAEVKGIAGVARDEQGKIKPTSLRCMLGVLKDERAGLGALTLEQAATGEETIAAWLNAQGKARKWGAKTWNGYRDLLAQILAKGMVWLTDDGKPRLARNPMTAIDRKIAYRPDHFGVRHLDDEIEGKLFAACDQLDRPQHRPNRNKLTQADADAIRARLADGARGVDLAREYRVSPAIISAVKHGDIWNPAAIPVGTKGKEMRRRLLGALRGGLRAGEMMLITLDHVNWRPIPVRRLDGTIAKVYEITLPAALTKGGKRTGRVERVHAEGDFARMLEARRFQLQGNPAGATPTTGRRFIFGAEDGSYQRGFKRMWRALYTLAGLDYGRDKGVVWHTTRHEFISRMVDDGVEPHVVQESARHRDFKTTAGYIHPRDDRRLAAVVRHSRE